MSELPRNILTDGDLTNLQEAARLIITGRDLKNDPRRLAPVLAEVQAVRFTIGHRLAIFRGLARDAFRDAYNLAKNRKMSPNASYKEAEIDETVVATKNSRDLLETAYETLQDFVTTNQTLLRIYTEESKNNL